MDQSLVMARQAQEDASYHAWMAQRCMNEGDMDGARFFQEEAAYFAGMARFVLGLFE